MATKTAFAGAKLASPRRIAISENEYSTGITSLDTIQSGVEELHTHGYVILENAIAVDSIDQLRTQMLKDAAICLESPDLVFNHGNEKNNFSLTPPLSGEFLFEDIWANKHASAIMQHIIGPKPLLCWASSNVLIKSGEGARQAVHSDAYADIPNFPFCVEMNIYLQDTNSENGSTEIWPGTHVHTEQDHLPHGRGWIKKKALNLQALKSPPIQPSVPAGSILMRDLRLWHAGMPSTSPTPRIVVALLYFPRWFRPHMRLTLPTSVRQKVESWHNIDLLTNTDFVEGSIDHLSTAFPMNFTQDSNKGLIQYRIAIDKSQYREPGAHIPVTKNNYWIPSKPRTRAATKRALEDEENDGGRGKKSQTPGSVQNPPNRRKSQVEKQHGVIIEPDGGSRPSIKIEVDDEQSEISNPPSPGGIVDCRLRPDPEKFWELRVKKGSEQDKNLLDSLPDHEDTSEGLPPWILFSPKLKPFRPDYTPTQGPGPQISPQFSPKSKSSSPHKMKAAREDWLKKHAAHLQELQQQQHRATVPEAKMLPDPQQTNSASPSLKLPKPAVIESEDIAWDADLGQCRSSRMSPYPSSPLAQPPFQFTPVNLALQDELPPGEGSLEGKRQDEEQEQEEDYLEEEQEQEQYE